MKKNKIIAAAAAITVVFATVGMIAAVIIKSKPQSTNNTIIIQSTEVVPNAASTPAVNTINGQEKRKVKEEVKPDVTVKQESNRENKVLKEPGKKKSLNIFSKDTPSENVVKSMNKESQTPWKTNKVNNYSACVLGKGEYAEEEGYASLIVKSDKDKLTEYKLKDEEKSQNTILQTEWLDENTILVITGSAYGTIVPGQKIYSINIKNDVTKLVFAPNSNLQRVSKMESQGDRYVKITVAQYTDDALNNYKENIKTIKI